MTRRPGLPRINPLLFYPHRLWEVLTAYVPFALYFLKLQLKRKRIERDPASQSYMDLAITPVEEPEEEALEMFELTVDARAAVEKARARARVRKDRAAGAAG